MLDIDLYNNGEILINSKKSIIYNIFIVLVIIVLVSTLLLSILYKYNKTTKIKGVVKDAKINLLLDEENYKDITTKEILINGGTYKVDNTIINEITYDNNYNVYYNVVAQIDLDSKYLIDNNILDVEIVIGKTTLYKEIIKRIRGE